MRLESSEMLVVVDAYAFLYVDEPPAHLFSGVIG